MISKKLENSTIRANSDVKVTTMGHILEIMYQSSKNNKICIKKLNNDEYINIITGEVKKFKKIENRLQGINEVRQSMKRLREYINTNATEPKNCKWVTLTYKENMMDTKHLYKDFDKFIKRLRYKIGHFEYIVCMEPQGRGAWHCHLLMIFNSIAPYIDNNKVMQSIWGKGYTKTQKLDNVDNIGLYLTAYMTDMPLEELNESVKKNPEIFSDIADLQVGIKELEINGKEKKFIKGARLIFYPPKFNLYRCSRGIKKPIIENMSYKNAQKKIGSAKPIFKKSIELIDEEVNFNKILIYEEYNLKR